MHILKSFLFDENNGGGTGGGGGSGAAPGGGAGTLLAGAGDAGGGAGPGAGGAGAGGAGAGGAGTGQPVVGKSFREGWIGADGKIDKAAYDRLPEHLKQYKDVFSRYETDEQLLQAFGNTYSLNGKKGLLPLPENASEADKAAFQTRLREVLKVPADVKGYGIVKPADVPDEQWNAPYVDGALAVLHKYNAPPEMVKELLKFDQENAKGIYSKASQAQAQALKDAQAKIGQEFGTETPQKMALARRMAATVGMDVNDPVLGNHPGMIIALARMAAMVGEDKLVGNGGGGGAAGGSTDREKAKSIVFDKSNELYEPYHDPNHGRHEEAVAAVARFNSSAARAGIK